MNNSFQTPAAVLVSPDDRDQRLARSLACRSPQYLARPPDMSNTAPVLKRLASVHSHATSCATSLAWPSLFTGLSAIMALTASAPRLRIMSVSIGPGATQLTKMLRPAVSRLSALVNAMTPALAAEEAASVARPSLPASEPIFT